MSKHINTYNNYLIPNWFIAFLLLFSIGGYTNYTPPLSNGEAIELVISAEENSTETLSFSDALINTNNFNSVHPDNTYLKLISQHHTTISFIKDKESNNFISLAITHIIFLQGNNILISEEDSFHLG